MIASMTAFARLEESGEWGHAAWEIRTVNHRYLDISIRLPEELRALETGVRECVSNKLKRGKVECNLRYEADSAAGDFNINPELAQRIIHAARELRLQTPPAINPFDVLRWPGVIDKKAPDLERVGNALMNLLDKALDNIVADRRREGEKIEQMIAGRCESFTAPGPANPKQNSGNYCRHQGTAPGQGTGTRYRTGQRPARAGNCPLVTETGRG